MRALEQTLWKSTENNMWFQIFVDFSKVISRSLIFLMDWPYTF